MYTILLNTVNDAWFVKDDKRNLFKFVYMMYLFSSM